MQNRVIDQRQATVHRRDGQSQPDPSPSSVDAARQQLDRSQRAVEQFVVSHPVICLGAAVASGIVLGWWVKRK